MSLPTSVLVALLAAAWLFVLVPMFARRREAVPDAYESTGRFRVLDSDRSAKRRRPHFGRRAREDEDDMLDDQNEAPNELDDELLDADDELDDEDLDDAEDLDDDDYDDETDGAGYRAESDDDEYEDVRHPVVTRAAASRRSFETHSVEYQAAAYQAAEYDTDDGADHEYADAEYEANDESDDDRDLDRVAAHQRPAGSTPYRPDEPRNTGHDRRTAPVGVPAGTPTLERAVDPELEEDPRYRPIPRRSGRGGFNPEAAERMRTKRYRRRRRIVLVLVLLTVLTGVAAHYLYPEIWAGTGLFGLLLVLYMLYLRRQVKIETDIRRRRMAKLQRARQTRPDYQAERRTEYIPVAHDSLGSAPAATSRSQQYADWQAGRTVVDLDDEDPGFDDLDYYRPVSYRKAVGQ